MAELRELAPSMFEEEGEDIVLKHLYIERRMVPLNLYLDNAADEAKIDHVVREYGSAIRELALANIFPATCCGRTSASPATTAWCSTTTTRSST